MVPEADNLAKAALRAFSLLVSVSSCATSLTGSEGKAIGCTSFSATEVIEMPDEDRVMIGERPDEVNTADF